MLGNVDNTKTAYQVQVASSLALLHAGKADVWDSGIIGNIASNNISYNGKRLLSEKRYLLARKNMGQTKKCISLEQFCILGNGIT